MASNSAFRLRIRAFSAGVKSKGRPVRAFAEAGCWRGFRAHLRSSKAGHPTGSPASLVARCARPGQALWPQDPAKDARALNIVGGRSSLAQRIIRSYAPGNLRPGVGISILQHRFGRIFGWSAGGRCRRCRGRGRRPGRPDGPYRRQRGGVLGVAVPAPAVGIPRCRQGRITRMDPLGYFRDRRYPVWGSHGIGVGENKRRQA